VHKKLPIGIQTFKKIIDGNYLYIDKTKEALELIENNQSVFLSRPRRFGKSLFLDTLQNIFEGKKELFKNLYIYDRWNFNDIYPVIKINFGTITSTEDLFQTLKKILDDNQKRLGVVCPQDYDYANCFASLIQQTYEKYKQRVVILVDEYDKAILDVIDDINIAKKNREILKRIYTEIKNNDEYIKFTFLTGVSRFSKASIFSGLNNIIDISLNPVYGNICGYTQNDIESSFISYLKDVDLEKVKLWYNGYNFLKDPVYNPFDILLFIQNNYKYSNYWFETATPSFLIKLMQDKNYFIPIIANLIVDEKLINSFDIENLDVEVILYQAGYLTIDEVKEKRRGGIEYKLKLPNLEVKSSLNDYIINLFFKQQSSKIKIQDNLYDALCDEKIEDINSSLNQIFASIPYNNLDKIKHYEGFYASIVYVYLQSLGLDIIGEDVTNQGRIDLTIKINNILYIIEFKVGEADALEQIKAKKYYEKYQTLYKDIYLIGINFDEDTKNISKFEWEKL